MSEQSEQQDMQNHAQSAERQEAEWREKMILACDGCNHPVKVHTENDGCDFNSDHWTYCECDRHSEDFEETDADGNISNTKYLTGEEIEEHDRNNDSG